MKTMYVRIPGHRQHTRRNEGSMKEGREDVGNFLDDCRHNMRLFMGHQLRCYVQLKIIGTKFNYFYSRKRKQQPWFY